MFCERKVVRRFVRSIVWDIGSRSDDGGRGGGKILWSVSLCAPIDKGLLDDRTY